MSFRVIRVPLMRHCDSRVAVVLVPTQICQFCSVRIHRRRDADNIQMKWETEVILPTNNQ